MINDMYARQYPFPHFDELQVVLVDAVGNENRPADSNFYKPLLKMHVFVALFRMPNETLRTGFLKKVFENYKNRQCREACDQFEKIKAVFVSEGRAETLAQATLN